MISKMFQIATERMTIRRITPTDYNAYGQIVSDGGVRSIAASALEKIAVRQLPLRMEQMPELDTLWLGGFSQQVPDRLLLDMDFIPTFWHHGQWDLRCTTLTPYREQGLMTEALSKILPALKDLIDHFHVNAVVRTTNTKSLHVMKAAGMTPVDVDPPVPALRHFVYT